MPKRILLVGHCGPDSTYLRMAVKGALGDVALVSADDNEELDKALQQTIDLVLFNRELGYGFAPETGVEMIRVLKKRGLGMNMMLVSNYPEAQAQAQAAGAIPGFGKREIGAPRTAQLLRAAVGEPAKAEK
ncbi:MAG: hypothetical protein M3O30_00930 [Planctomycetota bacterium]|nr:hypothetical protein [Planctomycetota bacterium]